MIDELRAIVLKRDGYKCVRCGSIGPKLYIHHKKYPAVDLGDLETLCSKCHPSKKKVPVVDWVIGKKPQGYRRVMISANPQLWRDFGLVVLEKHGKLHGAVAKEINLALKLYLKHHSRELASAYKSSRQADTPARDTGGGD